MSGHHCVREGTHDAEKWTGPVALVERRSREETRIDGTLIKLQLRHLCVGEMALLDGTAQTG